MPAAKAVALLPSKSSRPYEWNSRVLQCWPLYSWHQFTTTMQGPHHTVCSQHNERFLFSEQFQRSSVSMKVSAQISSERAPKLRKKANTPPRGEPPPKHATRSNLQSMHSVPVSETYFHMQWTGRGQKKKQRSRGSFFFGTKLSLSPRGRNILLLLGYLVKNVWARESEESSCGVLHETPLPHVSPAPLGRRCFECVFLPHS